MKPEEIQRAYGRAMSLQSAGKLTEAAHLYLEILKTRELAEPAFQLGKMSALAGRNADAAKWFERALRLKPKQAEIWKELLLVLPPEERMKAIQAAKRHGVVLSDKISRALKECGQAIDVGDTKRARKVMRKVLKTAGPEASELYVRWARLLNAAGHSDEALDVLANGLLEVSPPPIGMRFAHADALRVAGRLDEAEAAFRSILEDWPDDAKALMGLVDLRKQEIDSPDIAALKSVARNSDLDPVTQRRVGFSLAKGLEDQGAFDEAFSWLVEANERTLEAFPWKHENDLAHLRALVGHWRARTDGFSGTAPIFVVGMPRSGTTLVETILSMHDGVRPGGETGFFTKAFAEADANLLEGQTDYPAVDIGRRYAKALEKRVGAKSGLQRGTDKSITSYARIGHILNCLPDARFIVLQRDPRDVGVSIFKNNFVEGTQRFSTSLENIARQIGFFDAAVKAWQERVGAAMHFVRYEELVVNPEPQVRALLDFCGLEWEPACLTPQDSRRSVTTLSMVQVRNPINAKSVGAWRRFEKHLDPLISGIESQKYDFG